MEKGKAYSYRDDPAVADFDDSHALIVFDGTCIFCSGWVNFVLRHDRRGHFRFLTAQSPLGEALYRHYGLDARDYETNILIDEGRAYLKSEGSIRIAALLGYPWKMAGLFRLLPLGLRNALYDLIARNRYRIAGRRDRCFVPSAGDRERFL